MAERLTRSPEASIAAATRSSAPNRRIVVRPRRRSSSSPVKLPASSSCRQLRSRAVAPINAMKTGITGPVIASIKATAQLTGRIATKIATGTTAILNRAI